MKKENIITSAVTALVVILLSSVLSGFLPSSANLGGRIETVFSTFGKGFESLSGASIIKGGTFAVGTTGTALTQINSGTCYFKAYATTITASSSALVDCQATALVSASGISALTGVHSGDIVNLNLSTSTAGSTFMGLVVGGVTASTTNGYIQVRLVNLTGDTYTWPLTGTATGTAQFWARR